MKNKITEQLIALYFTRSVEKLREIFLFRVISAFAKAMAGKSCFSRAMILGLVLWILAIVPIGFTESFPNRPTEYEMEEIVILGKECVLGVNERCYATQTATNPVYGVAPFTNTSCWYLDQSLMGQIASKTRSLVSYYVDTNTVYNGTTNIVSLTVPELWEELEIGDHTNQFTQTFASGTNAVVYGDSPWRIYKEHLDERYDVLNVLNTRIYTSLSTTYRSAWYGYGDYETVEANTIANYLDDASIGWNRPPWGVAMGNIYAYSWNGNEGGGHVGHLGRTTGSVDCVISESLFDKVTFDLYMRAKTPTNPPPITVEFDNHGITSLTGDFVWHIVQNDIVPSSETLSITYNADDSLPHAAGDPSSGNKLFRGFYLGEAVSIGNWDFEYCK